MNYPLFSDIPDKCIQNTLNFSEWINDNTELPQYVLSEEMERQLVNGTMF